MSKTPNGHSVADSWLRLPALKRWAVFLLVGLFGWWAYVSWGDQLSLSELAARETEFRAYQKTHPIGIYAVAFVTYVAVAGLSLPGATAMTLMFGWLFGVWHGVLLVSFASTLGATLAFLFSRYLLQSSLQNRFGKQLQAFNSALERDGAWYLLTLRLIPAVPFFVINLVMGLTPLRLSTYWWVSQIGMLPMTAVYVSIGASFQGGLQGIAEHGAQGILTRELLIGFTLLGLFPLVAKKLLEKLRHTPHETTSFE